MFIHLLTPGDIPIYINVNHIIHISNEPHVKDYIDILLSNGEIIYVKQTINQILIQINNINK